MTERPAGGIDWESALQQHKSWLCKVLRCRIGDRPEVDDLFQEIALAVFRQNARPTDPAYVAAWLYRLAVRQAINFHRRRGRKTRVDPSPDLDYVSTEFDPLDWLLTIEKRQAVSDAMKKLRPQDREILMLKYTENWNYRQLASHLGVRISTIEYRLMRARKRLRQLLAKSVMDPTAAEGFHSG